MGIAIIVGAGVFVLSGQAAAEFAGPGVAISFVIAGLAATLAALCYSELISTVLVTGSTYTFVYAALGPLLGFIVDWNLLLEYLLVMLPALALGRLVIWIALGLSVYWLYARGRVEDVISARIGEVPG